MFLIYYGYFKYVCRHKWEYFKLAMRKGLWISAFTHDLSKYLPSEFPAYARWFLDRPPKSKDAFEIKASFDLAWFYHQQRNRHHWNHWVKSDGFPVPMPERYVRQMICDWEAMAKTRPGASAIDFYERNKRVMVLHEKTVVTLEKIIYK